MNSDFHLPDFNSYSGPTSDSISGFVLSTFFQSPQVLPHDQSHHSLPCDEIHQSPPRHKAHLIPAEIFSEVFLYTVQADPRSRMMLMLVCRYWHNVMLSTPGIHSQLRITRETREVDVERFGRRWLLDVTFDTGDEWYIFGLCSVEFDACFIAAAEVASRWRSLTLLSLPPFGEYKDLRIMHPLQHLESFKLAANCNLGNFLEPLITAITTTVTPRFTVMEVFHSDAAFHLVQPAHFQIFSSLTTLRLICKGMQNPVDILPSLHNLEIFEAHRLFLPIHPPTVDLPLTKVLRVLRLKSVSIQWMAGRNFPALEQCSITFPHRADTVQSIYLPSCSVLEFDSNNLGTLEHFHHPPLARLEIKCCQWRIWRGNLQLATLHRIFAAQSLTCLHMEIKCSERLLAYMLGLVPALEELWMRLSSPHALSSSFFLAFAARGRNAHAGSSSRTTAPLCRQLRMLHLHYKRWSRGAERNALIPTFGDIVTSHKEQSFLLQLKLGEEPRSQEWNVHELVEEFDVEYEYRRTFIGVSSPHGIVPLSGASIHKMSLTESKCLPLPRETEYITTYEQLTLSIDCFFSFHNLKEVRMYHLRLGTKAETNFFRDEPLFRTLMVLDLHSTSLSLLAGQTLHKLERYKALRDYSGHNPGQNLLTEMPVCTRLVVPLSGLSTLMLPQVRELGVFIDHSKPSFIWEKHIAVNANLSGLKLLHLRSSDRLRWSIIDIVKILGSLPALETLVLNGRYLAAPYVNLFEAFVPSDVLRTSGPNQTSCKDQISGVLCPNLERLQIEGIRLMKQSELIPILKDIVTLRAIMSPLKSFTFYQKEPKMKWELIGRDRSFVMEEVVPAERFQLDI
jgi:hypothetical protein